MYKKTIVAVSALTLLLSGVSLSHAENKNTDYQKEVKATEGTTAENMKHDHHEGKKYEKDQHEKEAGLQTTLPEAEKKDTHGIKSHDR